MKKTILFSVLALVLVLLSTSCNKNNNNDDDDTNNNTPDPTYYVEYNGTKYEVTQCYAFYQTMWVGLDHSIFTVVLVPDEVTYDSFMNDLWGTGDGFEFDIATESQNSIAGAHFEIDTTNNTSAAWEIFGAGIILDGDFGLGSSIDIKMKTGTCVIEDKYSGKYAINGSFKAEDGKNVTIKYEGHVGMLQMK